MAQKQIQQTGNEVASRVNKKHFIIYNNSGVISVTTPKDWARGHRQFFPNNNFLNANNTPTVSQIENILDQNGFDHIENNQVVIYYDYISI